MEKFLKNQQIPLTQVIDPSTGQAYYAPQNVVYDDKVDSGPTYLRDVIVDQAATASYFSGSITNAISASYAATASYLLGSIASASYALSASYAATASYVLNAVSASYAANGGVTQLLAGPNITLSPTNGLGQVTVSATLSGSTIFNTATGSYGSFYDTTTQTNPVADVPRSMSFNSTDITNGVSISGSTSPFNTYIKTQNAGVYNIQFSAQIDKTDSGTDEIVIWLRKNGIDLTDSATTITTVGNNAKYVAAWNWFVTSATGDYYQIIWRSLDTDLRLLAEPISGTHPGIPSVILTVNRVDQFLSNTGSFSGSFTGAFTGSFSGSVTAPGSTTQVVFNNGGVLGANSGFVYSGSRIGIGTPTPSASLHISGASSATLLEIDSPAVNNIMFVSGSGNVGIGTSNPTGSLHIVDAGTSTTIPLQINQYFRFRGDGVMRWGSSMAQGVLTWDTGKVMLGGLSGNNLELYAGGSSKMIISGSGNVGIGLTTDLARLGVRGSGATSGTTALRVENTNASASLTVLDNGSIFSYGPKFISSNTTFGANAHFSLDSGSSNTAFGVNAGYAITNGLQNASIGTNTNRFLTTGNNNVALGTNALFTNISGSNNVALGVSSLNSSTTSNNIAIGASTLFNTTTGADNTAMGHAALLSNVIGSSQTGIGYASLYNVNTGSNNTALGLNAGRYVAPSTSPLSSSAESIFIGVNSRANSNGETNQIVIGYDTNGIGSNSVVLGNNSITRTALKGSVGIGTTTPSASLHISGASSATLLEIDSPAVNNILFVTGSGRVGIGTNNPTTALHVSGGLLLTGSTLNAPLILSDSNYIYGGGTTASANVIFGVIATQTELYARNNRIGIWAPGGSSNYLYSVNGDFGIGIGANTPSARLQIRGSGATSATTALRVENTNASASLVVRDDLRVGIGTASPSTTLDVSGSGRFVGNVVSSTGGIYVGNNLSSTNGIIAVDPSSGALSTASLDTSVRISDFREGITGVAGYSYFFLSIQYSNLSYTSGTGGFITVRRGFAPTSGTGVFNVLALENTINQTGGANGITRGLFISPTITSATDFRAIETTSGSVIFGGNTRVTITGSLTVTGGITGSLQGTASYAVQALSASWAPGGTPFPYTGSAQITGSLTVTGSFIVNDGTVNLIDTPSYFLNSNTGNVSINWGSRQLVGSTGNSSLNWDADGNNGVAYLRRGYFKTEASDPVQETFSATPFNCEGKVIQGVSFEAAVSNYNYVSLQSNGKWTTASFQDTTAKGMLGIAFDIGSSDSVLLEGHITVADTTGYSCPIVANAGHGKPIYLYGPVSSSTTPPTLASSYSRILGHIYYNNTSDIRLWIMNFRPDHSWTEL